MYKKLFAVMIIAIFLITSVGVISAANDSISVKIVWDGNGKDIPDSVTVNLIKDGSVVDTAKLSSDNGWKTTFKVDDDGDYQVKEVIGSDYLSRVYGNAKSGFVIKNQLDIGDVLGVDDDSSSDVDGSTASDSDSSKTDASASDLLNKDNSSSEIDAPINGSNPQTVDNSNGTGDDNSTSDDNNGTDDSNSTDDSTDNSTDDSKDKSNKDGSKTINKTTKTTKTTNTTTTTKIIKQDKKKPENTTKSKNNHTGFPILVLVIAVFAAIFIPLNRKR